MSQTVRGYAKVPFRSKYPRVAALHSSLSSRALACFTSRSVTFGEKENWSTNTSVAAWLFKIILCLLVHNLYYFRSLSRSDCEKWRGATCEWKTSRGDRTGEGAKYSSLLFPYATFNLTPLSISEGKFLRGLCRPFNKVQLIRVDYSEGNTLYKSDRRGNRYF